MKHSIFTRKYWTRCKVANSIRELRRQRDGARLLGLSHMAEYYQFEALVVLNWYKLHDSPYL